MHCSGIDKLKESISEYQWYHSIDLGNGIVTPGLPFEAIWANIREARRHIDYTKRSVLDLGSMEGLWAFEAESLGARKVIATDCYYSGGHGSPLEKFLLCREILGSKVIPYYNVSPYHLWDRMDLHLHEDEAEKGDIPGLFDIVQHLGLLYHQRDVLLSLSQARSVIRDGGTLLIETAVIAREEKSFMVFNGVPPGEQRLYDDVTTWWVATVPCLREILTASLFQVIEKTMNMTAEYPQGDFYMARLALACRAIPKSEADPKLYNELVKTYRNPGLCPERFHPW